LEEKNDKDENERDNKQVKKIKLEETHEVEVINRIWAFPVNSVINVKNVDFIYRAPLIGDMNPNDIRYLCYLCGPSTKGFSRARDLMRHSVCSHDLFPSQVEQSKHYECNGLDLIPPTPEQYERYSDGSHRGRKKVEEGEKAEAARRLSAVRTKAGEQAKRLDGAGTSRDIDVDELVRRREVQVELQKERRAEAKKREEVLEEERTAAKKKSQVEEQQRNREEKKKKVREEWQKQMKLVEEEKKREDKIQFDKVLAKTLALEGAGGTNVVKKVPRKDRTSDEIDQEFRELNSGQRKANARLAVEELAAPKKVTEREKSATIRRRMLRAKEITGASSRLPPVSVMLNRGDVADQDKKVENVKTVREKRERKTLNIPDSVAEKSVGEKMDLESGEKEEDFQKGQRNEVRIEIPQDILKIVERAAFTPQRGEGEVGSISTKFLQNLVSDRMEMDLGEKDEQGVQEIVQDLEESGREA